MNQMAGNVIAVTITAKEGKSPGAVSGLHAGNLVVIAGGNQTPDGFIYTETASAVTIVGYIGASKDVSIPAQINGKPVTTIGENAFINKQLTSVTIPNSVTAIGQVAFDYNQLTSITIGAGVTLGQLEGVFPGDLVNVYNNNGKLAGRYTRPNTSSTEWTRQES
jgi:hypothetical protein